MLKKLTILFLTVLLIFIGLEILASAEKSKEEFDWTEEKLIIASGPTAGVFEIVAAASSGVLNEKFKNVSVIPGGSGPNILILDNKDATMGITYGNNVTEAWNGRDPSPGKEIRDLQGLITLFPTAFQIWALKETEISSLEDLTKLRVCAAAPGQAPWGTFWNLMDLIGVTEEDFDANGGKIVKLSWAEGNSALRDKLIDVLIWLTLYPHPAIMDVEMTRHLKLVPISEEIVDKYMEKYPGMIRITVPKGTYKNQEEDVCGLGTIAFYAVRKDLDEEVAYNITRMLYEKRDQLAETHNLLKYLDKKTMGKNIPLEIHPGAKKFMEEIGAPVDEPVLVP